MCVLTVNTKVNLFSAIWKALLIVISRVIQMSSEYWWSVYWSYVTVKPIVHMRFALFLWPIGFIICEATKCWDLDGENAWPNPPTLCWCDVWGTKVSRNSKTHFYIFTKTNQDRGLRDGKASADPKFSCQCGMVMPSGRFDSYFVAVRSW
jgi:hypothetical protein